MVYDRKIGDILRWQQWFSMDRQTEREEKIFENPCTDLITTYTDFITVERKTPGLGVDNFKTFFLLIN